MAVAVLRNRWRLLFLFLLGIYRGGTSVLFTGNVRCRNILLIHNATDKATYLCFLEAGLGSIILTRYKRPYIDSKYWHCTETLLLARGKHSGLLVVPWPTVAVHFDNIHT